MNEHVASANQSMRVFPLDAQAKDLCALPWGMSVNLFGTVPTLVDELDRPVALGAPVDASLVGASDASSRRNAFTTRACALVAASNDLVGRCDKCGAYINAYVTFERDRWLCSICTHANVSAPTSRYAAERRVGLPELQASCIEFELEKGTRAHRIALQKRV